MTNLRKAGVSACAVLALGLPPGVARADFGFQPTDPTSFGVMITSGPEQFATDALTNNPARATLDASRATLRQFGSSFTFGVDLAATGTEQQAFTAGGLQFEFPQYSELPFTIIGTAGEPTGTPVTLYLTSIASGGSGTGFLMSVNNVGQPLNQPVVLNGFKVGDEVDFGALADDTRGFGGTLTATLSFQPLGGPGSAAPEPGTLGLLGMGVAVLRMTARRKIGKGNQG